jgi:hypothetical protein
MDRIFGSAGPAPTVVFSGPLCHNAGLRRPAKGLPWRREVLNQHAQSSKTPARPAARLSFRL